MGGRCRGAWGVLVVLGLLLAGCAVPPPSQPPPPPGGAGPVFAHEHARFAMFLEGEQVSFNHADYDLSSRRNMTAHLHTGPEADVIHIEDEFPGGVPDVTLAAFLRVHGVEFAKGTLRLDSFDHHDGTTWPRNGTHRWQVWVEPRGGDWTEAQDGPGLLLRDGMRVLVTYGDPSPQELARQQDAVRRFPSR